MADDVAYVPLQEPTFIEEVEQKLAEIPAYEDRGVRYQGKYKTQQTETRYELKAQETRFYVLGITTGAFGSTLFPRSRPQTRFYCTKMIISHAGRSTSSFGLGQIRLADVKNGSASTRFYYYPLTASGEFNAQYDFSDSPRLFEGDNFDLYTQYGFGAGEFLIIQLFGWEEQP